MTKTHQILNILQLQLLKWWDSVHREKDEKKIQMLRTRIQILMGT